MSTPPSYASSIWRHNICELCWEMRNPALVPSRARDKERHIETCCFCGQLNADGIYVREDPEATLCKGLHHEVIE